MKTKVGQSNRLSHRALLFSHENPRGRSQIRGRQRWSRNFEPVVKVDRMMREVMQDEETKEPFARFQGACCA
jgi:hypothetical protein